MKILLAPDSFKGTMSSLEVIHHLRLAAAEHFSPLTIVELPIADGGEGTVEALVTATGGTYRERQVTGPRLAPVTARYGIINGDTAVIEMAQASGLPLLSPSERNPLLTTTYGTGELLRAVLDEGLRKITIGVGGSATNDGGIGCAQALGVRFEDSHGNEVGFGGAELKRIARIDLTNLDARLRDSSVTVICDVNNPLTGDCGATRVFGPQKGATPAMLDELEAGMLHYASLLEQACNSEVGRTPGAGAAGGLGAALLGFCGAKLRPGIETVLDLVDFERLLADVDLVVTGEGRIDEQTSYGKVPVGIAKRCAAQGVSVVAVVGSIGRGANATYQFGVDSIMAAVSAPMHLEEAFLYKEELLRDAADRMFRLIKVGMKLARNCSPLIFSSTSSVSSMP